MHRYYQNDNDLNLKYSSNNLLKHSGLGKKMPRVPYLATTKKFSLIFTKLVLSILLNYLIFIMNAKLQKSNLIKF